MQSEIVEYYDKLAQGYDKNRFGNSYGAFIDRQEKKILSHLLKDQAGVVVDLACGTGRLLQFADIGVDASKEMIRVSQNKFPQKTLLCADAENIPLEDESADTIFSFHFFMHMDPQRLDQILSECRRILKKNGRLIFDIPSRKRRNLIRYRSNGWHGATSMSLTDLQSIPGFTLQRSYGLLFLPIHRMPTWIRPLFIKFDRVLSTISLKEYSSYLVVELEKK